MSPKKVCWVFLNGGRVSGFQVAKCQVPVLSGPQLLPGTAFCGEGICSVCSDRLVMSAMDGAEIEPQRWSIYRTTDAQK